MLFNSLLSIYQLFFLILTVFFVLLVFRHLCIKRKLYIFVYHIILFFVLFIAAVGGGSVQNDEYARLEKFIDIEKNNQLDNAKRNLENYDSMLSIDLQTFKHSDEFRAFLKKRDDIIDKFEAIFIGWIFVLIADVAAMAVYFIRYITRKTKERFR